jgi:hypothetical protein
MGIIGIYSCLLALGANSIWADPPCASDHTMERAGNPNTIGSWARPANSPNYTGGYVGGGCPFRGESRNPQTDGTWGWDYVGRPCNPQRIFINWCHCQSTHPKQGTYKTDAPHVPNILASPPGSARQCDGAQPH